MYLLGTFRPGAAERHQGRRWSLMPCCIRHHTKLPQLADAGSIAPTGTLYLVCFTICALPADEESQDCSARCSSQRLIAAEINRTRPYAIAASAELSR